MGKWEIWTLQQISVYDVQKMVLSKGNIQKDSYVDVES